MSVVAVNFQPQVLWHNWGLVWDHRDELLHGLLTAIEVAAVALVISVGVGLVLALGRLGKPPLLQRVFVKPGHQGVRPGPVTLRHGGTIGCCIF